MSDEVAPWSSVELAAFLRRYQIDAQILHLDAPTPTVAAAAEVLGVQPEQIMKSVLFLADGAPVMVVACGLDRLDSKVLADQLGVARRRMKVANGAQVLAHTGYVAGSVPPFGYRQPLRTLVDTAVRTQSGVIYGGGGDVNALLRLTVGELLRVVEGGIVNYEL